MNNEMQSINISKQASKASNTFLIIYLFLYVFQPAFLPIKMVQFLTVFNIVGILFFCASSRKLVISKDISKTIKGYAPFLLYVVVSIPAHLLFGTSGDAILANIINLVLMMVYLITALLFLMGLYKRHGYSLIRFDEALIIICIIQLVCVIVAYLFPGIREFFNGFTLRNSNETLYINALNLYQGRSYGLAENLFDGLGCISALIISLAFCKGLEKKNTKLNIISIVMMIIPLLNSRTGLIMAIIGVLLSLLFYQDNKHRMRTILYIILVILIAIAFVYGYQYLPEETKKWFGRGLNETLVLLKEGRLTGVYEELLVNDFIIPDRVLIGMGASPEMLGFGNVDNGYVQFLWRYGLIGIIMFLVPYISMFLRVKKQSRNMNTKCICIVFIVLFFVYMFKMLPINNSAINFITFGYVFYSLGEIQYGNEQ